MHQDTNTVTATAKTKAPAPESSTDLDPFLSYFPAPPSGTSGPNVAHPATCYPSNQTEKPDSSTTGDSLNICTSVPPRSSSLRALSMSSSSKVFTTNSNFVISNEERPPCSRSGSIETINDDNDIDTRYPYNTQMYGSTPLPSSSAVKESQKPTPPSPVYADMILPRYLQPQSLINEASFNVGPNSYSVLNTTRF
ncbi:hypothetical protein PNOK_0894500 [Pyrrhoderma noxium]|uniref:Uncharacterized protein n=1 Tax=Pyrrhoderma noxium TaxID=2282107 RepID=A0A286U6K8_9AGAM|nr:hypothetical protein PNOK_0894500 [Pyrrhoderma noxium]